METTQNKLLIPIAIIVAGVLVAGAIFYGDKTGNRTLFSGSLEGTQNSEIELDPVTEKDHVRGSRSAPIVIVEYSDIECPFCKIFHSTMKQVLVEYGNRVAWVYRHFPIPQLHQNAIKEAEATECAAELGGEVAFWSYLDKIFETTNSNDSLPATELPKIASSLSLNVTTFNNCLNSGKHNAVIQAQIKSAIEAGARGTPYSVIVARNGDMEVINGAEPFESVKAKIDALLK